MAGKQAKILAEPDVGSVLAYLRRRRYPDRDRVIFLASIKCGLRAAEIAGLRWEMVLTPTGEIDSALEVHNQIAKKGSGRTIPLHPLMRTSLARLKQHYGAQGHIIRSERGARMTANSIVNWFALVYRALGLAGCSSHSGRRTFITRAAKQVYVAGGSLRDVQQLAGHSSIGHTQKYIEGDSEAKQRLIKLI